jgi:hypothetical protein
MAAKYYLVEMADHTLAKDGVNTMVVIAENAADAKLLAQASIDGDSNGAWAASTATEIASLIAADVEGWTLTVVISNLTIPAYPVVEYEVSVVGAAANTFNDLGTAMAAALVVEGLHSSYATPKLTVSTIGDAIGDRDLKVYMYSPDGAVAMTAHVSTIKDEGIAGATLEVDLVPARTIATVAGVFKKN